MKNTFLAIDLGTTVGRAVLGELNDGILSLQEIHQFTNEPILDEDHKYCDIITFPGNKKESCDRC